MLDFEETLLRVPYQFLCSPRNKIQKSQVLPHYSEPFFQFGLISFKHCERQKKKQKLGKLTCVQYCDLRMPLCRGASEWWRLSLFLCADLFFNFSSVRQLEVTWKFLLVRNIEKQSSCWDGLCSLFNNPWGWILKWTLKRFIWIKLYLHCASSLFFLYIWERIFARFVFILTWNIHNQKMAKWLILLKLT